MMLFSSSRGHSGARRRAARPVSATATGAAPAADIRPPCALRANGIEPMRSGTMTNAYDPAGIASAVSASAAISALTSAPACARRSTVPRVSINAASEQHEGDDPGRRAQPAVGRAQRQRHRQRGDRRERVQDASAFAVVRPAPMREQQRASRRRTRPTTATSTRPSRASVQARRHGGDADEEAGQRINPEQRRFRHHPRPPVGARRQRRQPFPGKEVRSRRGPRIEPERIAEDPRPVREIRGADREPRPRVDAARARSRARGRPARDRRAHASATISARTDRGGFLAHEREHGRRETREAVAIAPCGSP